MYGRRGPQKRVPESLKPERAQPAQRLRGGLKTATGTRASPAMAPRSSSVASQWLQRQWLPQSVLVRLGTYSTNCPPLDAGCRGGTHGAHRFHVILEPVLRCFLCGASFR
jgi:hypothetical protein